MFLLSAAWLATVGVGAGCTGNRHAQRPPEPVPVVTVVIAPVLNLSNTADVETLKLTDVVAAELQSTGRVAVVPANLARAALLRLGKPRVESPEDAVALAREFSADAALVVALTEYDPYHPPRIGLVMQWYALRGPAIGTLHAADAPGADVSLWQFQRMYSGADDDVMDAVRAYAREREGHESPYEWRKFVRSQELFLRYCCWASLRSILRQGGIEVPEADENDG